MRSRLVLAGTAAALCLALVGCAATADDAQPEASAVSDLNGEWRLAKGSDAAGAIEVNGAPVTLVIANDAVSGQAPCNTYTGEVAVDGSSVVFGTIAQTLMACTDDARTELESRYLAALEGVTGAKLGGETLTLIGADVTLQFVLLPKKSITR